MSEINEEQEQEKQLQELDEQQKQEHEQQLKKLDEQIASFTLEEMRPEIKKAIDFFERVNEKFPRTEDGQLDASKLDYHFIESLDDSPESMYIRGKIPEMYLRGSKAFSGLYEYFYRDQLEEGKDAIEPLTRQLMNGNTSDYKALDGKVTAFLDFAKATQEAIKECCEPFSSVMDRLWVENRILPESMKEEVERFRAAYDAFAKVHDKGSYVKTQKIHLDDDISEEERKAKGFIIKIYNFFKGAEQPKGYIIEDVYYSGNRKDKVERELSELAMTHNQMLSEMEQGNNESLLEKMKGLLTKKHNEQDPDAPTVDQIEQQILEGQKDLESATAWAERAKIHEEMADNIKNAFYDVVHNEIIPRIKEKLGKSTNPEESLAMLSYFFSEEKFSKEKSRDALSELKDKLRVASRLTKEDYDAMLSNALMTISVSADALVEYEKWEKKGLRPATRIFRDTLNTIPRLKGEKPLSNELATTWNMDEQVFKLNSLVHIYRESRKKEDLDEYIREAVYIWTKYNLLTPYDHGNARTANHFLAVMLAERGIVVPSLYTTLREQAEILSDFKTEFKKREHIEYCDAYLEFIREKGIDITGQNRLRPDPGERVIEKEHPLGEADEEEKRREEEESCQISVDEQHTL